ncbi:MAG: ATP-grasp domain-containing protein [Gemmatimonadota bacterium]|nr:ATP-grasp domain-containing protein [Gemmatimonadota bacterium]
MARILVTDGEQRSSLAAVRSLGRAGHEVLVCSARRRPLAGASRYARSVHRVSDPLEGPDAFRGEVAAVVEQEGVDVLLPMTDISVPLLLPLRERIPGLLLPFPEASVYEGISDKRNLMEVAGAAGVPVPRQMVVETREAGASMGPEAPFEPHTPVVLKPARSAVVRAGGVQRFGVRMLDRAGDLEAALRGFPDEAFPVLVQERITGPGLGAFVLAEGGRTLATFGHRRIREKPPTGGVSVYREAVPLRADVRAHAETILEAFGWTGVAMVEFKEDAATGTPYLMEVNGRFWGSLQLAVDAGVDFPRMLVELALEEGGASEGPGGQAAEPRSGVRSRWLWGDVDHLLWILLRGRKARVAHPTLPTSLQALGRFLVPWRPGDRFEVLRLSDPGPFLRESVQWVGGVLGR